MSDVFSPDGLLAATLPGFEYRPQQAYMASLVFETLASGGITLIEAGTGTGKSLAYLFPAVRFALETGERVVVSTNTINLQEQLVHKDIPFVRNVFAPELKVALVKGWQNYLCLHRYQNALQGSGDLFEPEAELQLAAVREWVAAGPEEGSLSELPFSPSPSLWSSICAESDTCLRQECPLYEHCFLFKARRQMEDSHLLVVNHHLLFADVAVRGVLGWQSEAVLPPYSHLIIDEAHHVEDVATDHLGNRLSELGMRQLLGRIVRRRRRGELGGYAGRLVTKLPSLGTAATFIMERIYSDLLPNVGKAEELASTFFAALSEWAGDRNGREEGESAWAIVQDATWRTEICPAADELSSALRTVADELSHLCTKLRDAGDLNAQAHEGEALAARARRTAEVLDWLVAADDPDSVFWLEREGGRKPIRLCSAPVEIGPHLASWLRQAIRSVVMCSATLTVNGSFDYVTGRWGIQTRTADGTASVPGDVNFCTAKIDSPFDYRAQSSIHIPSDIAEPGDPAFTAQLVASLGELLVACGGRAFVLFTSYAQLRYAADTLRDLLERHGLSLWVHGEAPRLQLLTGFKETAGSVLFGTDSFWEGVDVQGEALSLVVIAKLPFEVPTHPVAQARTQRLRERGLNPFENYSVPRAALKLKQGFGRLIRSASDRGAVVIYDRRLLTRRYGQVLLSSLPPAPVRVETLRDLPASVRSIVRPAD